MTANQKTRVEVLEGRLFVEATERPEGVFISWADCRRDAPPDPDPLMGWRYGDHRIMRAAGESDDDLAQRAVSEVEPFLGKHVCPVFLSVNEAP